MRSLLIHSLTRLVSVSVKFRWNSVEQEVFYEIKLIVAKEILIAYPNFNKRFDINTDASDYQLL